MYSKICTYTCNYAFNYVYTTCIHTLKEDDPLKRVLSIGGFDSAWLADLVAFYILEKTEPVWSDDFAYLKIYRDDGYGLARNTTVRKLCKWHNRLQRDVD